MAIVPNHCTNSKWQPGLAWPDDCGIQWGSGGVVISSSGNYRTDFFEAFPKDGSGGFIRGEGKSLNEAEANAYAKWEKQKGCLDSGGHQWSRTLRLKNGEFSTYNNGGCFCLKCGSFQTAMHPVIELGAWRNPLSSSDFSLINMGIVTPFVQHPKHARRLYLRSRMFGVDVPDWRDFDGLDSDCDIEKDFILHCQVAVRNYVERAKQWLQVKDLFSEDDENHCNSSHWIAVLHERAIKNGFIKGEVK